MSSTVKMVAVVDGDEITVGRCHPGQARILRKQGLAEWKDGKVVFLEAPPTAVAEDPVTEVDVDVLPETYPPIAVLDTHREFEIIRDEDGNPTALEGGPPLARVTIPLKDGWCVRAETGYPVLSRPLTESAHHDLVRQAVAEDIKEIGSLGGPSTYVEMVRVDELELYMREIAERKSAGHTLVPCDDPMSRTLGFIDDDEGVGFDIPLTTLKSQIREDVWVGIGDPETPVELRDAFRSSDSRSAMLGYQEPEMPDMSEEELACIWESAPECDLNPYVGIPFHNEETGRVEIPIRGIDPLRVMNVAGRAVVGRPGESRGPCPIPGWSRFRWPEDIKLVGVSDRNGGVWPSLRANLLDGYFLRRGKTLLRIFNTWSECWWDVSELCGETMYRLVERHKIDPNDGAWWDVGAEEATNHLASVSPSEPEST